ncbi:hypothetical protein [Herbidospora cretacea]|uniref:hypothetical protein n=1 Tax=Herbidospora cretacea TaxID=28444 RepID=UPI000AE7F283|nr:hypothetical protein [Herbidospora cretacea]
MSQERYPPPAVFVDQSGRRRRLITMVSIGSSIPLVALLAVVIGGLFSDTGLSVHGWPGERQAGPADIASPSPARKPRPERPSPSRTRAAIHPAVSTARPASPSARPSHRPRPVKSQAPRRRPEHSPSPTAEPTTSLTTVPTTEPPDAPSGRPTTGPTGSTTGGPTGGPTGGSTVGPTAPAANGDRPVR